jgi:hypothetical protein
MRTALGGHGCASPPSFVVPNTGRATASSQRRRELCRCIFEGSGGSRNVKLRHDVDAVAAREIVLDDSICVCTEAADSRFSIITSFNWLSFRGDAQLEFRDERGYYVGLTDTVNEVFETYRARFDENAATT